VMKSDVTVGEEINLASGVEHSIGDVARELIAQINPAATICHDEERVRPGKSEVERLLGCNKKIRELTGWTSQFTLKKGLAETIAWFRQPSNLTRYKADIYNL